MLVIIHKCPIVSIFKVLGVLTLSLTFNSYRREENQGQFPAHNGNQQSGRKLLWHPISSLWQTDDSHVVNLDDIGYL